MLIPYITLANPHAAMDLYKQALGATVSVIMDGPGGSVMHAEMNIVGQRFMLGGEWPGMSAAPQGRSPVNFMLYVDNADDALKCAVDAGMTITSEPENMFWGDRIAKANDGHGYEWTFAHNFEPISPEEMSKRAAAFVASMGREG